MLKITIPAWEDWDPVSERFSYGKETKLILEHSLLSIARWEMKYQKPYLTKESKTKEEVLDYIRFMTVSNPNKEIPEMVYYHLTANNLKEIENYISNPMTATTISKKDYTGSQKVITSEQIYYSMASFGIPFECEKWHFNRLIMLLEIASENNKPKEKMSKKDIFAQNRALNEARKAKMHSRG